MTTDHRWLWIVLGVLALVVLLGPLVGGGIMGPGLMWGYGGPGVIIHGNGWAWGLGMGLAGLAMLAFWGALIVGGILLVRWLIDRSHARSGQGSDDPLAILQRRYAAGEIDQATYERMRRDLTGTAESVFGRVPDAGRTSGQGDDMSVLSSRRSGPSSSSPPPSATACPGWSTGSGNHTCYGPGGMMGTGGSGGLMGTPGPGGLMGTSCPGGMMGNKGPGGMWSNCYPGGMMGDSNQSNPHGKTLTLAQAQQSVQRYIGRFGNPNLAIDEIVEFQRNFYAIAADKSTGHGAFEVLVNKATGAVFPEYGPAMMWNTAYGLMGSMMGYQQPRGPMPVSAQQATRIAQRWLDQNQPGATTEAPDQFPGYYTLHLLKNGQVAGMLSVNGYSGEVWYHTWHGAFIRMKVLHA